MDNCFACESGGDALSFIQLREGLAFPQALERLRAWTGERQPARSAPHPKPTAEDEDALPGGFSRPELLGRVVELYTQGLQESREAQEYLTFRGLDSPEVWKAFHIGAATGKLLATLPAEGEVRQALLRLGVITRTGRELFAGCVVVPLEHPDLGVVGLYGRKIDPKAQVRHLYLPGRQRGVLNWQALKLSREVFIAESVLDAISMWRAGCTAVTCLFGVKGIPVDLDALLGRYAVREVRFCLDGDAAGREATERLAAALAGRGIRCAAVDLPEGSDPNRILVEQGAPALRAMTGQLRPLSAEQPPASEAPPAAEREETGDGFLLRFGDATYRVTPRPPFDGRLRVLLRSLRQEHSHVDTLDLFSHRARATAVAQVTRHLQLPREVVERHFLTLIEEAERWVAATTRNDEAETDAFAVREAPPMSEAERAEALGLVAASRPGGRRPGGRGAPGLRGRGAAEIAGLPDRRVAQAGPSAVGHRPVAERRRKVHADGRSGVAHPAGGRGAVLAAVRAGARLHAARLPEAAPGDPGGAGGRRSRRLLHPRPAVETPVLLCGGDEGPQDGAHGDAPRGGRGPHRLHGDHHQPGAQPRERHPLLRAGSGRVGGADAPHPRPPARQPYPGRGGAEGAVGGGAAPPPQRPAPARAGAGDHPLRGAAVVPQPLAAHAPRPRAFPLPDRGGGLPAPAPARRRRAVGGRADVPLDRGDRRRLPPGLRAGAGRPGRHAARAEPRRQELWPAARELVVECMEREQRPDVWSTPFTRRQLRDRIGWHDKRLRTALQELVDMEYLAALAGSQGRAYQYRVLAREEGAGAPAALSELTTPDELEALLGRSASHTSDTSENFGNPSQRPQRRRSR